MKINLKNDTGMLKTLPVGYNWLIAICGSALTFTYVSFKTGLLMCIPGMQFIVAGNYNRKQIEKLLMQGFKPADDFSKGILQQKGIIANENGTIINQSSPIKKVVIGIVALFVIISFANRDKESAPKIDLNTAEETVDVDKLNDTLLGGTELQQKEIMKQSKNGVLETYIHIENVESAYGDCVRIKSFDTLGYQTIFKTNSVVCPSEKVTKDVLIGLQKGHTVKIKGVITGFDTYTHVGDDLSIRDRYIVKMNPAIITEIVK